MTAEAASHHPRTFTLNEMRSRLVSRKTGILRGLNVLYGNPGEPRTHLAVSELTDSSVFFNCHREASGTGVGVSMERALTAALGEAVEGYCAYDIRQQLLRGSYREIAAADPRAVSPHELPLYSPGQYRKYGFRYRPFTEDAPLRWSKGVSAVTGKERILPAGLVYAAYRPEPWETPLCHTIFGGVASSTSHDAAMLSGLYEVVERDAMMIWWLGQLPMARVIPRSGSWLEEVMQTCFRVPGLSFELWHITMDIPIPIFFGLVTDATNQAVAGGFGANLDPSVAALKALFECVQNRLGQLPMKSDWGRNLFNTVNRKEVFSNTDLATATTDYARMTDLNNNLLVYLRPENHHLLNTVCSGDTVRWLEDIPNLAQGDAGKDLRTCLDILREKDFDVIVSDLTHEDVAETGFVVLRVNIPGLVPNTVTAWPHLGNPRLYDVPRKLGFPAKTEAELADFPMPYA